MVFFAKKSCRRIAAATWLLAAAPAFSQEADNSFVCPKEMPKVPEIARADVYAETPFKAGEEAVYELTWAGLKAGYGTIDVRPPRKHNNVWHRVFHAHASTGDWFKAIFVAKEELEAISRPWDFGISRFYMDQNEGKLFSRPFVQKKWLDFDHDNCKVSERVAVPGKDEQTATFDLSYGANDSLGVIFNLRTRTFKTGQKERVLVYTSEKNWYLEAEPVAFEKVTVPAGTFDAVKLKLQTYIGKDLQQKGDVYAWIATDTPDKQLVQIQGEIKIGSVWIKLHKYKNGR
jgi:hypothetical protein